MMREIITILLVITAVLFAGCTGQDEPGIPEQVQQTITPVSTSFGTVAMTTVTRPVTTVHVITTESPIRIFNGEYHWAEYRINNTVTMPPNPRYQWEYNAKNERSSELYNGIPAIHEKITITGDDDNFDNAYYETENMYFEKSTKRFLGGTITIRRNGVDEPEEFLPGDDIFHEDRNWGRLLISPFEEINMSLSAEGVESVTVPAGTFPDARTYSGKFHNLSKFPITFWISKEIPVPVQYRIQRPDLDGDDPIQTFELMGWG